MWTSVTRIQILFLLVISGRGLGPTDPGLESKWRIVDTFGHPFNELTDMDKSVRL